MSKPIEISNAQARAIWLGAQRLNTREPFGGGADAVCRAVEHLGYVQIDTINVIERCHHHILFTRIPAYERQHLHQLQSVDKSVFEYWTHALSYVPVQDYRYFVAFMKQQRRLPMTWFAKVDPKDVRRVVKMIRDGGPLSIQDIDDDVLVEKDHAWASRKPSKRALQLAFFTGVLTVSARSGMLKTYELADRHFSRDRMPKAATEREYTEYKLDRALRSQGIVSLDSICHLDAPRKAAVHGLIEKRAKRGDLLQIEFPGAGTTRYWTTPNALEQPSAVDADLVHILSPFDPLVIQRKRLAQFFGYEHRFEAYVPKDKRVFGYFALPVLVGDEVVAAIDLKTDRQQRKLIVQQWTWLQTKQQRRLKQLIEEELHRFERFQLP